MSLTPSHVQSTPVDSNYITATNVSQPLADGVTAGNLVVCTLVQGDNGGGVDTYSAGTCSKSSGASTIGTVTLDGTTGIKDLSGNEGNCGAWSAEVTGSGTLTMQVSGLTSSLLFFTVSELTDADVNTGTRVEDTASADANTGAPDAGDVDVASGGMIFGIMGILSTSSITQGSGYTLGASNTTTFDKAVEYLAISAGASARAVDWTAPTGDWMALGVVYRGSAVSAALTGTLDGASEADVVAGGETIILTLTGDTWIPAT